MVAFFCYEITIYLTINIGQYFIKPKSLDRIKVFFDNLEHYLKRK